MASIMEPGAKDKKHGLRVLKSLVSVRGLNAIDKRSQVARALLRWKEELIRDLGGDLSAQKLALVELAVRTRLYIDHVDSWILRQPNLVMTRKRALMPVVRERQMLVDSFTRILSQLGLERAAKPVLSLQEYLATRSPEPEATVEPVAKIEEVEEVEPKVEE